MRLLTYIWRVWFYIVIAIVIILLFPVLYITSRKRIHYRHFFFWSRIWAWVVLVLTGFWPKAVWHQRPKKDKLYIICPNHTSMIDIMMTLALFPNCFLFIGKMELAKMPLFGYFYKKTNLLVDRSSMRSRKDVFDRAAIKLDEGIGLCIYPEGGVPEPEIHLGRFKAGAFRLAVDKGIPIIPVSYPDNKRHLPYEFGKGSPGVLRAVIHPFLYPKGTNQAEAERLSQLCYELIESGLEPAETKYVANEIG